MNHKRKKEYFCFAASIVLCAYFTTDVIISKFSESYYYRRYRSNDIYLKISRPQNATLNCLLDWESAEVTCKPQNLYSLHSFGDAVGEIVTTRALDVRRTKLSDFESHFGDFYNGSFLGTTHEELNGGHTHDTKITVTLQYVLKTPIEEGNILSIAEKLKNLTSSQDLKPVNISFAAQILSNIADVSVVEPDVLSSVINTIDRIIDAERSMADSKEDSSNVSSKISAALDMIVSKVHTVGHPMQVAGDNIALSLLPINSSDSRIPRAAILEKWSSNVTNLFRGDNVSEDTDFFRSNVFNTFEAGVVIPDNVIAEMMEVKDSSIAVMMHKNMHIREGFEIVSSVIDVSLLNFTLKSEVISPPVEMELKVSEVNASDVSFRCVFWDQTLNDSKGGWSSKGCNSFPLNSSRVRCSCYHLTSFAVIFDLRPGFKILEEHQQTLSVITYIGCILSIVGLGCTILTFFLFWKKMKLKAIFNLSLALIWLYFIFLFGVEKGNSNTWCVAASVLIHYLMLASFTWMLVLAAHLYIILVQVFKAHTIDDLFWFVVFAWGSPGVIVVMVLSINHKLYFTGNQYCCLSDTAFYYAVAAPITLMLLMNFVIFGLIVYEFTFGKDKSIYRKKAIARKETLKRGQITFFIFIALGLSWIFGLLAAMTEELKLPFQYLFAISASSQGFLIFLLFVIGTEGNRKLWLDLITPAPKQDKPYVVYYNRPNSVL